MHGNGALPLIGSHESISNITIVERIKKSNEEGGRKSCTIF